MMLLDLKKALLDKGIRQNRLAADLRWDPTKLSRIVNGYAKPNGDERRKIADAIGLPEERLFT